MKSDTNINTTNWLSIKFMRISFILLFLLSFLFDWTIIRLFKMILQRDENEIEMEKKKHFYFYVPKKV